MFEEKDGIYKYTKNLFKSTRDAIFSAIDSFCTITNQEVCLSVKKTLELKYAKNIALIIFLDNFIDNLALDQETLQAEMTTVIKQFCENNELFSEEDINDVESSNEANIQQFINELGVKYFNSNPDQVEKARVFANRKIKPLLNISDEAMILTK